MPRSLALVALTIALMVAATGGASAHHYDSLLAPTGVCPGQTDTLRSIDEQEWTMRCMHNHVRSKRGLPYLSTDSRLMSAAGAKSADIVRCREFAHEACRRDTFFWTKRSGYASGCWGAGENIAWGSGSLGSVRAVMSAWLHSGLTDRTCSGRATATRALDSSRVRFAAIRAPRCGRRSSDTAAERRRGRPARRSVSPRCRANSGLPGGDRRVVRSRFVHELVLRAAGVETSSRERPGRVTSSSRS